MRAKKLILTLAGSVAFASIASAHHFPIKHMHINMHNYQPQAIWGGKCHHTNVNVHNCKAHPTWIGKCHHLNANMCNCQTQPDVNLIDEEN